ncbi:MAG: UTP--glucose-1-phosphate uridylyltransferase, partial [Alphaproteobacteria bacterium MarineAlpha9_Bin5]
MSVRKAIFPVAGLGTRFLPATKSVPKEMLPVVDKPLLQYAVEEAQSAGIEQFIFVVSPSKNAIANHFGNSNELERVLGDTGKPSLLASIRD